MIKRAILLLASLVTVCCGQHFSNSEIENLKESFANPPQSAKPMVWWHWMNGNVTPEGLRMISCGCTAQESEGSSMSSRNRTA